MWQPAPNSEEIVPRSRELDGWDARFGYRCSRSPLAAVRAAASWAPQKQTSSSTYWRLARPDGEASGLVRFRKRAYKLSDEFWTFNTHRTAPCRDAWPSLRWSILLDHSLEQTGERHRTSFSYLLTRRRNRDQGRVRPGETVTSVPRLDRGAEARVWRWRWLQCPAGAACRCRLKYWPPGAAWVLGQ